MPHQQSQSLSTSASSQSHPTRNRTGSSPAKHSQPSQVQSTTETDTAADSTHPTTCPECSGDVVYADNEGICSECNLVVTEEQIDHGPEWRAFSDEETQSRSRTGRALTNLQHDRGLSTTIDWKNKDADGNALSMAARKKMQRLRTWQNRARVQSDERILKKGFTEINRMGSALNAPEQIRETAAVLYRKADTDGIIQGRSVEGMGSAVLYHSFLVHETPRSLDEITTVSRVGRKEISRTYSYLKDELDLPTVLSQPSDYVPRFRSEASASKLVEIQALEITDAVEGTDIVSGINPVSTAAAALYIAGHLVGEPHSQKTVSQAADVTTVTIRNHVPVIVEYISSDTVIDTTQYEYTPNETDYRYTNANAIEEIYTLRPEGSSPPFNNESVESATSHTEQETAPNDTESNAGSDSDVETADSPETSPEACLDSDANTDSDSRSKNVSAASSSTASLTGQTTMADFCASIID